MGFSNLPKSTTILYWSDKRHLSDPVKEISRHPEVVPHLDSLTRANLHHDGDGEKLYENGSNWIGSIWFDPIGLIGWELTWNSHWAGITSAFVPPEIVQWQFDLKFFNDNLTWYFSTTIQWYFSMTIQWMWYWYKSWRWTSPHIGLHISFPVHFHPDQYVWFKINGGRRRWWPMLTPA